LTYLQQAIAQRVSFAEARQQLIALAQQIEETTRRLSKEGGRARTVTAA